MDKEDIDYNNKAIESFIIRNNKDFLEDLKIRSFEWLIDNIVHYAHSGNVERVRKIYRELLIRIKKYNLQ